MATPHVSGVAALVWSHNGTWTNAQIRQALQQSAEDLGAAGRDNARTATGWCRRRRRSAPSSRAFCGTTTNTPPTASFSFAVTDLTATFTDTSTDSDGSVASWSWSFGDGATSTAQNPTRTYAAGGTYTVTLTVTDNAGATAARSQSVTVTAPSSGGITLSARGYKVQGNQRVDLTWSGATSSNVDVYRDTTKMTVANRELHGRHQQEGRRQLHLPGLPRGHDDLLQRGHGHVLSLTRTTGRHETGGAPRRSARSC
jgi:serine protease